MEKLLNAVEKHADLAKAALDDSWKHPETGFRETVTSDYMEEKFRELGYNDLVLADGITGFYTVIDT